MFFPLEAITATLCTRDCLQDTKYKLQRVTNDHRHYGLRRFFRPDSPRPGANGTPRGSHAREKSPSPRAPPTRMPAHPVITHCGSPAKVENKYMINELCEGQNQEFSPGPGCIRGEHMAQVTKNQRVEGRGAAGPAGCAEHLNKVLKPCNIGVMAE